MAGTKRLPDTPQGIIDELRQQALRSAFEIGFPELEPADLLESQAADLIEHYETALRVIARGEGPAREIATKALDWLARFQAALKMTDPAKP